MTCLGGFTRPLRADLNEKETSDLSHELKIRCFFDYSEADFASAKHIFQKNSSDDFSKSSGAFSLYTVTQCVVAFLLPVPPQYLAFQKQCVLLGQLDRMQLFRFYQLIDILP